MKFGCTITESALYSTNFGNEAVGSAVNLLRATSDAVRKGSSASSSSSKSAARLIVRKPRHVSDVLLDYPAGRPSSGVFMQKTDDGVEINPSKGAMSGSGVLLR